jgi:hypothetical protein
MSTMEISAARAVTDGRRSRQRSRVTNGSSLFARGNGRSTWARRFKDVFEAHVRDLGGVGAVSQAQVSLCRRAATLTVALEEAESRLSAGRVVDMASYTSSSACLHRILKSLGLGKVDEGLPTLADYLAASQREGPAT